MQCYQKSMKIPQQSQTEILRSYITPEKDVRMVLQWPWSRTKQ